MAEIYPHAVETGKPESVTETEKQGGFQASPSHPDGNGICIVSTRKGEPLCKGWKMTPGWAVPQKAYKPDVLKFDFSERKVESFDELARLLQGLGKYSAVVRGRPVGSDMEHNKRRTCRPKKNCPPTLRAASRRVLALDFDGLPTPGHIDNPAAEPDAVAEYLLGLLGPEFDGVSRILQMTASAGIPKAGKDGPEPMRIYARIWVWLSRPVSDREAKAWLPGNIVDHALYNPVQLHYTAAPMFEGMHDPCPLRWTVIPGDHHTVEVPAIQLHKERAAPTGDGTAPIGGGGRGYEGYKAEIGDHPGGRGIWPALRSCVGAYWARHGSKADAAWLVADLTAAVRSAVIEPGKRADGEIEKRIEGIPDLVESIRQSQAAYDEERAAKRAEADDEDDEAEPPSRGFDDGLPVIFCEAGKLTDIVDEAERALIARHPQLFQRGNRIVRPGTTKMKTANQGEVFTRCLIEVNHGTMTELMGTAARFTKWDGRMKEERTIDPPANVVSTYLQRAGHWNLPIISALVASPTIRPDGSILDKPGYDEATGLLYDPDGAAFPTIPEHPTKKEAEDALALLKEPLAHFPWADRKNPANAGKPSVDLAVALSGILTAAGRNAMDNAPLHAFSAPKAGSGKSKLVEIAAVIATGRVNGILSQAKTPEEFEKRLGATLIEAHQIVSIDNCEYPLGGDVLCQALTEPLLNIRPLGFSKMITVQTIAAYFATGNNLVIADDMTRRVLLCGLDAGVERPELRDFDFDPVEEVRQRRGEYLAAALTVLRAYVVAARPMKLRPIGSFGRWSDLVRSALVWLGEADPAQAMERARDTDPKLKTASEVFAQWWAVLGATEVTTKALIDSATSGQYSPSAGRIEFENADLRHALLEVAGVNGNINSGRLGTWLGHNQNSPVNGFVVRARKSNGSTLWCLVRVEEPSPRLVEKSVPLGFVFDARAVPPMSWSDEVDDALRWPPDPSEVSPGAATLH